MKKILVWAAILLAVLVGLSITKNTLAQWAISGGVSAVTGLRTKAGSVSLGISNTRIGIQSFKIYNPGGFKDREMLSIQEVYVDYNLWDALKGDFHIEEMRLDLEYLVVVKNAKGLVNIEQIKTVKQSKERKGAASTHAQPRGPVTQAPGRSLVRIDVLQLRVGKVVYKDYSIGAEPVVQEFDVGIDERFEHVANPADLVSLILTRTLTRTTISRLANLDIGSFDTTTLVTEAKKLGAATVDTLKKALQF